MIHLQATDDSPVRPVLLFYYICAELVGYIELGLGSSSTVTPVF